MTKKQQKQNLIPPGDSIKENLEELGLSQKDFAVRMGITEKHVIDMIKGRVAITPETAIGLSNVLGSSPKFWLNLDAKFQIEKISLEDINNLMEEKRLLPLFINTYSILKKLDILTDTKIHSEKILHLRSFFGVANLMRIEPVHDLAFRKSGKNTVDNYALAAWIRYGELNAQKESVSEFDKERLKLVLPEIKQLVVKSTKEYLNGIKRLLNSAGVKIYYSEYFSKSYANGVVRWIQDNPVILISLRFRYSDIFWFTLFHEIGHVLLHGKTARFIEYNDGTKETDPKESEANKFAQELLIHENDYRNFIQKRDFKIERIKQFADEQKVHPGIIAGRLAHDPEIKEFNFRIANSLRQQLKLSQPTNLDPNPKQ